MTALFLDGFDHYGSEDVGIANMLDGVWANATIGVFQGFFIRSPTWGTARTGTGCLRMASNNTDVQARLVVPGTPSKMYISFGLAVDVLPELEKTIILETRDVDNLTKYSLTLTSTGAVSLWSGRKQTHLATSAGAVVRAQTWHFFEICIDYTAGIYTVRVDDSDATGTPVLTHSIATGLSNAQIVFSNLGGGLNDQFTATYYDDLFIRDSTGSVNNSWLGDRRIATLYANADTATAGWTPSYYHEFGSGVLRVAHMETNNSSPTSPNACVTAAGSTSLDTGANDFTIESFVRFQKLPGATEYSTIFSRWDALNNKRSYRLVLGGSSFNASSLQFDYSTDGAIGTVATPIVFPWTPDLNVWYHIAVVRASNELLLFVNGQQFGLPIACSATFFGGGNEPFAIGAEVGTSGVVANTYVTGMYDETRFTNGFARYTTAFAVPTSAFPRNLIDDPEWADVVLLCGYNTPTVQDESSFARPLTAVNSAATYTVTDGPAIGVYSTINKPVPDDNTFISAALTNATGTLTMTTQPTAGNTVRVGTTDGSTPAVYTFRAALVSAYDVLIDTTAQNTLLNLMNAINAGAGIGTKYGTGTLANFDVSASQLPAGQIKATALTAGTGGNSIVSTATGTAPVWGAATLTGGASIPGPSDFKVQRPPANTTLISAVQPTVRAYKSDAGLCTLTSALIGPLGAVGTGASHSIASNAGYYLDVIEEDPDTSGPITPATLINGKLRITRTG